MNTAKQTKDLAKIIFANAYNYPSNSFRSIGRGCFVWAMTEAKRQLAEAARIAAIPAAVKAERIDAIRAELEMVKYIDSHSQAAARRRALNAELTRLAA